MLLYINDPQGMSNSKGFYVTKVKHEVITTLNVAHLSLTQVSLSTQGLTPEHADASSPSWHEFKSESRIRNHSRIATSTPSYCETYQDETNE